MTLPPELELLTKKIAANVHDIWAAGRIVEGWKWGEVRNNEQKITLLLVPYECLPESEKEYGRRTAMETLKLIVKLGYNIVK